VIDDFSPGDLTALAELMAGSPLLRRYGMSRDGALESLSAALQHGDVVLIARSDDGSPEGIAWLQHLRGFGAAAYLRLVLVAEDQQRRGLGERLLTEAERRAATWSRHLLVLTTADNDGARRFYERLGYRQVGRLEQLVLPDVDELLYHKALHTHEFSKG
jgi:GNAT superfamily N-acetyltransferase